MKLTERQVEVAELVARGLSGKAIAQALGISPKTVDRHIQQAAKSVPGPGKPRHRLTLWFFPADSDHGDFSP